MPETKNTGDGSGGRDPVAGRPRKDARMTRRLIKQLKGGGTVTVKQLRNLNRTIKSSNTFGTFTKKDQAKVGRLINQIEKRGLDKTVGSNDLHRLERAWNVTNRLAGQTANPRTMAKPTKIAPQTTIHGKNRPPVGKSGKGSKGGKGGGGRGGMGYFGLGSPPNTSRKFAASMVQGDINDFIRKTNQQIKQAGQDSQFDINQINALHERTQGDLNKIFGEASDFIGGQQNVMNQRFDQTGANVNNIFNQAIQQAAQNSMANRDAASSEMQRLGILNGVGLNQFDADQSFNQNMLGSNQANANANLQAMQQSSNEVGNLLGSMSNASLASALGRAANSRQDSISETQQQYRQFAQNLINAINNAQANKGSKTNELWLTMRDSDRNFWLDTQQQNFNNQLATNQFNLDTSRFNADQLWKKAAQQQALREAQAQKKYQQQQQAAFDAIGNVTSTIGNLFPF